MIKETYLGYSTFDNIRRKATSGGIGSTLIKYLFDSKKIDVVISFRLDEGTLKYRPYWAYSYEDYNITGAIYQEVNLIKFIKENPPNSSVNRIAVFCLPCQTKPIANIFKSKGYDFIIIGLVCSSQQSFEATKFLLQTTKIKVGDVISLRYRGDGWPGGIKIKLKNGEEKFFHNNISIWTKIFHSRIFILNKCFFCQDTLNKHSDIVLADPWIPEILSSEVLGKTIFACYTQKGLDIVRDSMKVNYICANRVEIDLFHKSQQGTIQRKSSYKKHPKLRDFMIILFKNKWYKKIIKIHFFFKIHNIIKQRIEYYMQNN